MLFRSLITDMDQPLGRMAGNSLEIIECIDILNGKGPSDLRDLCLELAAWMFYLGGRAASVAEGKKLASEMIASGRARDKFREIIRLQGGDHQVVDDPSRLPHAHHSVDVPSTSDGFLAGMNCEQLGTACVVLGGGREKKDDSIDHAVGLVFHKKAGDRAKRGETLCTIHYNSEERLGRARPLIEQAYRIENEPPRTLPKLIQRVIGE